MRKEEADLWIRWLVVTSSCGCGELAKLPVYTSRYMYVEVYNIAVVIYNIHQEK